MNTNSLVFLVAVVLTLLMLHTGFPYNAGAIIKQPPEMTQVSDVKTPETTQVSDVKTPEMTQVSDVKTPEMTQVSLNNATTSSNATSVSNATSGNMSSP
jgi:hypothetical protein